MTPFLNPINSRNRKPLYGLREKRTRGWNCPRILMRSAPFLGLALSHRSRPSLTMGGGGRRQRGRRPRGLISAARGYPPDGRPRGRPYNPEGSPQGQTPVSALLQRSRGGYPDGRPRGRPYNPEGSPQGPPLLRPPYGQQFQVHIRSPSTKKRSWLLFPAASHDAQPPRHDYTRDSRHIPVLSANAGSVNINGDCPYLFF